MSFNINKIRQEQKEREYNLKHIKPETIDFAKVAKNLGITIEEVKKKKKKKKNTPDY